MDGKILFFCTHIYYRHYRCFDEIFLTWNESEDSLYDILNTMNRQYPDMKIAITISDNINYLDVNLSHTDGDLKIHVANNLNIEPYALPYVFGHHPQHQYDTLLRAALIRATQCCADVFDFANELEDLELSFQYNRFKKDYFLDKFQLFLEEFAATDLKLYNGETYYNQSLYDYLRQNISNYNHKQKKAKLKRCQRQTIQYRWQRSSNYHED
jgi:hypothetical protein